MHKRIYILKLYREHDLIDTSYFLSYKALLEFLEDEVTGWQFNRFDVVLDVLSDVEEGENTVIQALEDAGINVTFIRKDGE